MNNQFATQFLREEVQSTVKEDGGSTVGGGVTGGPTAATFTADAGEQVAGAKGAFKEKYQEDARRLAGNPAKTNKQGTKNLTAYMNFGFTKAPNAEEAGKHIKGVEVEELWEYEEGEPVEEILTRQDYDKLQKLITTLANKAAANPRDEKINRIYRDVLNSFLKAGMDTHPVSYDDVSKPAKELELNENYSRFKNQTKTRPKTEQFHQAIREVRKKIHEIQRVFEYVSRLKEELNEGEEGLKYKRHTEAAIVKIKEAVSQLNREIKKFK